MRGHADAHHAFNTHTLFVGEFTQEQLSAEAFNAAGAAAMPPEHQAALYAQHQALGFTHDNTQQQKGEQEKQTDEYHEPAQAVEAAS